MTKIYKLVILLTISAFIMCFFVGMQDLDIDDKYIAVNEHSNNRIHLNLAEEPNNPEEPVNETDLITLEPVNSTINFYTNTSAEDPSKLSWGYAEWRAYIIIQSYNITETELDDSILTNETFQQNIHISTIMAWGQYNGSLSEEGLLDLYNQIEHYSVSFDGFTIYESSDERLDMKAWVSIRSIAWFVQFYKVTTLNIMFMSRDDNGKWRFPNIGIWGPYTLNWLDSDPWDTVATQHSIRKNIVTGSLENNLIVMYQFNCLYNGIPYDVNGLYLADLKDDDTTYPSISTTYDGDYTDSNSGVVKASAYDKSGYEFLSLDTWDVENSVGTHSYRFVVRDLDRDRPGDQLTSYLTRFITIHDDDTSAPAITITYHGTGTDADPGYWSVSVEDPESDVAEIKVSIDEIEQGTTEGNYDVPNELGSHEICVYAINNDKDRPYDQEEKTKCDTKYIVTAPPTNPVVEVWTNQVVNEGCDVLFIGSYLDTGGPNEIHYYKWDFGDGEVIEDEIIDDIGIIYQIHRYIDDGAYVLTLTIYDDYEGIGSNSLMVIVNNVAPFVQAGEDQTVDEGTEVRFAGSFYDWGKNDFLVVQWDYGDGMVIYNAGTATPKHTYDDNGVYTVTLTVFDNDGAQGSDTLTITVINVAPTVEAGEDQTVDEGTVVNFAVSITDPGEGDTHTCQWDFGDGTIINIEGTIAPTHTYDDNGVYTVTLTVLDDDNGEGSDFLTITVNNVAPTVEVGIDQTVDEGTEVSIVGSFDDAGEGDTHTCQWDFGDGTIIYEAETLTPTHIYEDNGVYTVTLTVIDDDLGEGSDTLIITVNNVAPTVEVGEDQIIDEGSGVTIEGSFTDPGPVDTHTATINWGDGLIEEVAISDMTILGSHVYEDDGVYTVTLTVIDDDLGEGSDILIITVNNVAPTVEAGADQIIDEGTEVTIEGSFTDPSPVDTYTATINWGDGIIEEVAISDMIVLGSHIYEDDGVYTVILTVLDDDLGEGSDTLTITVNNVAPTVEAGPDQIVNEQVTLVIAATFSDPGLVDTHTATINWGDGIIEEGEISDMTVLGRHVYEEPGFFTITITVKDKDGDIGTDSLEVLVLNSYLTDGDLNPLSYFDFIFRKDQPSGFALIATNPGQFFYHIEILNNQELPIDSFTIDLLLPPEFALKGAMPVHVYLDGIDITNLCDIVGTSVTVTNIPSGSSLYIMIHMDFGLKGEHFDTLEEFIIESYSFGLDISSVGIFVGTDSSISTLIGHQKKTTGICGFVTDTIGNPRPGIDVYLYSGGEIVATATTDENGFYYFIDLNISSYYLIIGSYENPIIEIYVVVKKDDFTEVNLVY